jgi:hypothetical protein
MLKMATPSLSGMLSPYPMPDDFFVQSVAEARPKNPSKQPPANVILFITSLGDL